MYFVTFPLFDTLTHIIPKITEKDGVIDRIKENKKKWAEYKETDEDKDIYKKKERRESGIGVMWDTKAMRLSKVIKL